MPRSVNELLLRRADTHGSRRAYLCVDEDGVEIERTFAELARASGRIAAALVAGGLSSERALLLYPPGADFLDAFFGSLRAGTIAVPAPPPHPSRVRRTLPRLVAIAKAAEPQVVLTTSAVRAVLGPFFQEEEALRHLEIIATDELATREGAEAPEVPTDEEAVAFIQYTSGSTADPKGVVLSHGNLLHNLEYFYDGWDHEDDTVVVSWLPTFHDLGLVYGVLAGLHGGFPTVLLPPVAVMQRPQVWLEAISRHRGTHSMGPNFAFELCLRKVSAETAATLDLSSWKVALNAAEPIRWQTIERFQEKFAACGFRPETFCAGYGLSEGTCKVVAQAARTPPFALQVSGAALERHRVELVQAEAPDVRHVVACGRPGMGTSIAIVDPMSGARCGDDDVGEIWVKGDSVGKGYFRRPDASAEIFEARLADDDGTWMRTGDLGFLHDGDLFITGRHKDMVIIRGENHYPQDIEFSVQEAHSSVRPGCIAAFAVDVEGEERLVVVAEAERRTGEDRRRKDGAAPSDRRSRDDRREEPALPAHTTDEAVEVRALERAIRGAIATGHELMVHEVVLIRPGSMPKTSSGKVQRRLCRSLYLEQAFERVPENKG